MAEIRKKGPNKFLVLVFMGRDAEGKRIYERELFNGTESQAKKWASQWETELKKRLGPTSLAMTVGDYLEKKWLPGIKNSDSVSDRTHETYTYHVRRLKPLVGHLPMYNLNGMALQDALPKGCFGNVKPKTVKGFYGTLKTALKQAVAWGILIVDPTVGLRTPRVPKKKPKVLTSRRISPAAGSGQTVQILSCNPAPSPYRRPVGRDTGAALVRRRLCKRDADYHEGSGRKAPKGEG